MGTHFREQDNFVSIVELTPALRRRIENTIEHLVALLDDCDGDADCEPWLGWTHWHDGRPRSDLDDDGSDREAESEHDEDGADDEPTMGWSVDGHTGRTFETDECKIEDDRESVEFSQ